MTSTETSTRAEALACLRALVGRPEADFHDGQFEAISALVDESQRALVVQRTGWGKSAVYFVSTMLLRERGAGPTLLVSPLLSLMRDQVEAAARAGVRALAINSANRHEWEEITARLRDDTVDVLLVSPERLNNPDFRDRQLPALIERTGLLVIDEAHCISDWGHDFRPDYRRLRELVAALPARVPVLATTATANERVVADVAEQLGGDRVRTIRGPLARTSLRLGVLTLPDAATRLAWLVTNLGELPGSGIIYTLTVAAAEDVARILREAGHETYAYTGKTDAAEREDLEQRLKLNEVKALVATSALGMGFDKPDLGFVVHLGAPSSPVAYYQQVGRAGRATDNADVLLLPGAEDQAIWDYFATASMPDERKALALLDALTDQPQSTQVLESKVDLKKSALELLLKVLDVDGAVRRVPGGWVGTGQRWRYDAERYRRVAAAREGEQRSMLDYERTSECRMQYLQLALDDADARPCGRCDNCAGPWYPSATAESAREVAGAALRRAGVEVEVRKLWPTGADSVGVPVRGKIAPAEQYEPGRALARLSDLGWGGRLRELLAPGGPDVPCPPDVIGACVQVLAQWDWAQRPAAVVSMPSRRRPRFTGSLARGLAEIGHLPYLGELALSNGGPTGGPGGNSVFRLSSVWGRFDASGLTLPTGAPVLLVDDLIDSRWSITVAARELRNAGAGAVLPFAAALQG
ncbi:RecQ family ATP-dependent DNA helicase [Gryllotalpicola daejeonensis]|uniref:DNA 3'-5' helicase n=1 Tax=Gryllotalpicola daejeonensis TaxID=993087 RepID=A0ABP7ZE04_9MICO